MATGFVDFYIDIKSPYAFLALEPSLNTFAELDLEINFFPYILDIADYLGSAKVDNSGKVIEENRSAHQWRRVKYSYMDCRRLANLTGKTILGTQKIWDTRLVSHLMIWAKENAKGELVPLIQYVFERFWKRELNVEKARLSPSATLNYSKTENKDLSSTVDEDEQESVKATISWPIIQGGKNFSSIKKFKHKKEKNKLLLDDKENEIKTQTAKSWSFYQSSESVMASTEAQLKAAEIANEGITLEYDSGNTRTTLEVIQSRSLLLEARISHVRAQKDLIVSKLELLSQVGDLKLEAFQIP